MADPSQASISREKATYTPEDVPGINISGREPGSDISLSRAGLQKDFDSETTRLSELKEKSKWGLPLAVTCALVNIGLLTWAVLAIVNSYPVGAGVALWSVFALAAFLTIGASASAAETSAQRSSAESRVSRLRELLGIEAPSYVDRLVGLNLENLDKYYRMVKVQAARAFFLASAACVAGFALIVAGAAIDFSSHYRPDVNRSSTNYVASAVLPAPSNEAQQSKQSGSANTGSDHSAQKPGDTLAWLTVGSGVITEAISALFFILYSRTVQQLRHYHQSLVSLQNTLLAIKLVEGVDSSTVSSAVDMTRELVLQLSARGSVAVPK